MHILLAINWIWGTKQRGIICSLALTFQCWSTYCTTFLLFFLSNYWPPLKHVRPHLKHCSGQPHSQFTPEKTQISVSSKVDPLLPEVTHREWLGQALGWEGDLGHGRAREAHELWAEQAFVPETGEEPGEQRSRAKTLLLQERSLIGFRSFVGSGGLELIIKEVLSISVFLCVLDLSKGNRVSLCEGLSFFFCFKRLLSPRRLQVIRDIGAYSVLQWIWKQSISNILM